MTFTFNADLNDNISRTRIIYGDILSTDVIFADETVEAYWSIMGFDIDDVTQPYSFQSSQAVAVELIKFALAKFARSATDKQVVGVSTSNRFNRNNELRRILEDIQRANNLSAISIFSGGTVTQFDTFYNNSDNRKPLFTSGIKNSPLNPNTAITSDEDS